MLRYRLVLLEECGEVLLLLPAPHGGFLYESVCVLPGEALVHERKHHLLRVIKPVAPLHVLLHPLRVDVHSLYDARHPLEHVVGKYGAVGDNNPFNGGVRDVAFVPEGDVLEPGKGVCPQHPRQAGEVLASHGVSLVRHRGGALLPLGERLLGLEHLGPLKVPYLHGYLFHSRAEHRERREVFGVAVALNDLCGHGLDTEAEFLQDCLFELRRDVRECAHRS